MVKTFNVGNTVLHLLSWSRLRKEMCTMTDWSLSHIYIHPIRHICGKAAES